MAKKTYIVVTPLRTGANYEDGSPEVIDPGKSVSMEDKEASPLLACGAIRVPDVVEGDSAPSKKK